MSDKILKLDQAQTLYSDLRERIDALPTTEDIPEVPVQDIQINGNSILSNGIANIPEGNQGQYGVYKLGSLDYGLGVIPLGGEGNILSIAIAPSLLIKLGASNRPIVAGKQHESVFFGLSKAAGADLASEANITVGTYPAAAKTAIQNMLDVPSNAAMTTAIGNAIGNINSFDMAVVQALPTQDISTHTIYLVPKTGETNDVYDEYVYINSNWEMVGNTQVDLSNYVQKTDYATTDNAGVVKFNAANGITVDGNGIIKTVGANASIIKAANDGYRPIIPAWQG